MKKFRVLATALAAAAFLAGCGGNEAGNQAPRVAFTQMINFGDSLSDVGTYDVGAVAAQGGGHYSINGKGATGLLYINWTEFLAAQLDLSQPCAAETGLNTYGAVVTATFHDTGTSPCYNYAQGGSRVTEAIGPGNIHLFDPTNPSTATNAIGALTIPVTTQIDNFLANTTTANNGKFPDNSLVTVFAGGNDIFINVATYLGTAAATTDTTILAAAAQAAVTAMVTAADDEVALINTKILANGAKHVVVVNLPDVSLTPYAIGAAATYGASAQAFVKQLTTAFNTELAAKLTASDSLLLVDAYTASQDQVAHMAQYGLTDVTTPVCTSASSLVCTKSTLIAAVTADPTLANGYEYADTVHPTPYGYRLLAELVGKEMAIKGWL